jgi:hypothetical protein
VRSLGPFALPGHISLSFLPLLAFRALLGVLLLAFGDRASKRRQGIHEVCVRFAPSEPDIDVSARSDLAVSSFDDLPGLGY